MIEKKEENLEENKIKSARRKTARRNYNKRENKINEEAKNEVKKETKNIKKAVRRTTRRVNKEQEETKALVVRKESSLKELPREKALKKVTEKVGTGVQPSAAGSPDKVAGGGCGDLGGVAQLCLHGLCLLGKQRDLIRKAGGIAGHRITQTV